jgi:hypothetical protein
VTYKVAPNAGDGFLKASRNSSQHSAHSKGHFLRDKLSIWANNGRCVEEVWNNFKNIVLESIERFIPHKILRKNSNSEYYNKEVKKLKLKVRRAYNRRKLGQQYREELKRLSKVLLLGKIGLY